MSRMLRRKKRGPVRAKKTIVDGISFSSGLEAYMLYGEETKEHLKKVGAKIIFSGPVSRLMIGEADDMWDLVAIAEYPNRKAMLEMIMDPDYSETAKHREAAIEGQLNIEVL